MEVYPVLAFLAVALLLLEAAVVLRRGARQHLGYLVLLGGNLTLLAWVVRGQRFATPSGAPSVELAGALVACTLLVLVPRLLERLARYALAEERFDRAARIHALRELLVPGLASAAERAFYEQIADARAGRSDEVIDRLRRELVQAEPPLDQAIQERIVTVLLFAGRFREAVTQYELHLAQDPSERPALAVQMIRAYGVLDEIDGAAALLHRLEERADPRDPTTQALLLQGRLQLLAQAGALGEVERLLLAPALRRMPRRLRASLLSTVRERARIPAPEDAAAALADAAPALAGAVPAVAAPTPTPTATATPAFDRQLSLFLDGVAMRAASELRGESAAAARPPPATLALIVANVAAFALFALLVGDTESGLHLVRGGASFHPAVRAGAWWRLMTALFLHGNLLHLFLNVYGLFLLGRVVERAIGTPRFLCVYGLGGLAGNVASAWNPDPAVVFSIGASGAVLAVMAALMVLLMVRRRAWRESWRRQVLFHLSVLVAIQMALGFWMHAVDSYAHVGGLVGGAVAALLLAPGGLLARGRASQLLVAACLVLLAGALATSVAALVREDPAHTLAVLPRIPVRLGDVTLAAPAGSEVLGTDASEGSSGVFAAHAVDLRIEVFVLPARSAANAAPPTTWDAALQAAIDVRAKADVDQLAEELRARKKRVELETADVVPAPTGAGWSTRALALADPDLKAVFLYYARAEASGRILLVRMLHGGDRPPPRAVVDEVGRLLGSITVAAPAAP